MKTKLFLSFFVLAIFLFTSVSISQEKSKTEAKKDKTTTVKKDAKSEKIMCAVMPEMEGKKNINYTYKGKKYYFCCKDCLAKFKKEPEKYIKK